MGNPKKILLFFVTLLFLKPLPLLGSKEKEESLPLVSLKEVIQIALKNNKKIQAGRKKLEGEEAKISQAKAEFLPSLSLGSSYLREKERELPPGIISILGGPFSPFEEEQRISTLSLTQPLYTSGKLSLPLEITSLEKKIAEEELSWLEEEIIFQVKKTFYDVLLGEESLKIAEETLRQVESHLEVVEELWKEGLASHFDLLRSKVEVENAKFRVREAENALFLSQEALFYLLGGERVKIGEKLLFKPLRLNKEEVLTQALSRRSDLKKLKLQKRLLKKLLSLTRTRLKPTLYFSGDYEYDWLHQEDSWRVILNLDFPLLDSGRTYFKLKEIKAKLKEMEKLLEDKKEEIKLEVEKVWGNLLTSLANLKAQKSNLKEAKEALAIAEERYKSGVGTNLEVLDAEVALEKVKFNHLRSLYEYNLAMAELKKITQKGKEGKKMSLETIIFDLLKWERQDERLYWKTKKEPKKASPRQVKQILSELELTGNIARQVVSTFNMYPLWRALRILLSEEGALRRWFANNPHKLEEKIKKILRSWSRDTFRYTIT